MELNVLSMESDKHNFFSSVFFFFASTERCASFQTETFAHCKYQYKTFEYAKGNWETPLKVIRRTYAFSNANSRNLNRYIGKNFHFF